MPAARSRIIIDTNLWISFLIKKDFSKLDKFLYSDNYSLLFSSELLDEFLEVIQRPKFASVFTLKTIEAALEIIIDFSEFVKVTSEVNACRDPKDNYLLSMAQDGHANYLITGDKDLLALKKFGNTKILTITDFLKT